MGKYQVPAVVGAIKVLRELGGLGELGATQSDLVEATGLSKSTMHNLLSTLEANDFVRRDADTRIYRLGPALIPLGAAASRQIKLIRSTIERIAPLAAEHRLSFAVAQKNGDDEAQIIERFYPEGDVHVGITVGSTYGPLDGALGKVLLAAMDEKRAAKLIQERRVPAHTPATKTSPESLRRDVEEVRSRGWSASEGELNENYAIAAPVWGANGELELLLLALGFRNQLEGERLAEIGELLRSSADDVMRDCGIEPAGRPRRP